MHALVLCIRIPYNQAMPEKKALACPHSSLIWQTLATLSAHLFIHANRSFLRVTLMIHGLFRSATLQADSCSNGFPMLHSNHTYFTNNDCLCRLRKADEPAGTALTFRRHFTALLKLKHIPSSIRLVKDESPFGRSTNQLLISAQNEEHPWM